MKDHKDVELVHASLQRMGTMSLAEAYTILGYKPHHYYIAPSKLSDWKTFERAVDGKWPYVSGAKPERRPFTRADWDAVRGDYDLLTDLYSHHSPDLVRAYPEAKVVVVQRDFESWWKSYKLLCIDVLIAPSWAPLRWVLWLAGIPSMDANEREKVGFFGVDTLTKITPEVARQKYEEFFAEIRALVPPEKRLEYKLGDGWEPLCRFLEKPVPDVPFPRVNNMEFMAQRHRTNQQILYVLTIAAVVGTGAVAWCALAYVWDTPGTRHTEL